jgi:hypothetical protein
MAALLSTRLGGIWDNKQKHVALSDTLRATALLVSTNLLRHPTLSAQ